MLRKKQVLAVVGIVSVVVASLTVLVYAAWTPDQMANYMFNIGRHKIYQTNWILYNDIDPKVDDIKYAIDKLDFEVLTWEGTAIPGFSFGARLFVLVTHGGEPVTGLTGSNFQLFTIKVPGGGGVLAIDQVDDPATASIYILRLTAGTATWKAGEYFLELWVTQGTKKGATLSILTIT